MSCSSTRHTSRLGVLMRSRTSTSPFPSTMPAESRTGSTTTDSTVGPGSTHRRERIGDPE